MDSGSLILMALLVTVVILSQLARRKSNTKPVAPSPPALPIVGHMKLLTKEPFHRTLESMSRLYGPVFRFRLGRCRFLIVSSPDVAEECLAQNDLVFANRPSYLPGELLGYNSTTLRFAPYGDLWRNLRRVATLEALSSHRLQKSARIRVDQVRLVARQLLLGSGSGKVDLTETFFLYTRNVVMTTVAGKSWASSGAKDELFIPNEFVTLYDYFPVLRWVGYGGLEKKMKLVWLNRDKLLQGLIDEARSHNPQGQNDVL